MQGFVAQAQSVHRAGAEVLDQHVHAIDQFQAKLDSFRVLEIDADAAFPPVEAKKEVRLSAGEWRPPAAPHIAATWF